MKVRIALLAAASAVALTASAQAAFVAYNDFGGTSTGNTTAIAAPGTSTPSSNISGKLVDYTSGTQTGVTLTTSVPAGYQSPDNDTGGSNGAMATSGDAATIFGSIINGMGYVWYGVTSGANNQNARLRLTFTGCAPGEEYSVALFGNRNNNASKYLTRYTVATIAGADSFSNTSSADATKSTVSILNDTATVMTGYNTIAGSVARFSDINAGADGSFYIDVYGAGVSNGENNLWYLNAMQVTAVPEPAALSLLGLGAVALIRRRRA